MLILMEMKMLKFIEERDLTAINERECIKSSCRFNREKPATSVATGIVAEAHGFEPWNPFGLLVFKTSGINRSPTLPYNINFPKNKLRNLTTVADNSKKIIPQNPCKIKAFYTGTHRFSRPPRYDHFANPP